MKLDAGTIITLLSILGGLAVLLLAGWMIHRKGVDIVSKKATEEWKSLAEALEGRVQTLTQQVAGLQEAQRTSQAQIAERDRMIEQLTALNLQLQTTNSEQRGQIIRLEDRVRMLEAEPHNRS